MSAFPSVTGYPATVWSAVSASLVYAQANTTASNVPATLSLANLLTTTLKNARDALDAYLMGQAMQAAFFGLEPVIGLALDVPTEVTAFVTARVTGMQSLALALAPLPATPSSAAATALTSGLPAVPYTALLETLNTFGGETPPDGLTTDAFSAQAAAEAAAWGTVAAAMQGQGVTFAGSTLSAVLQMQQAATEASNDVANISVSEFASLPAAWNALVAIPAYGRVAAMLSSDPTTEVSQQISVMQYLIGEALATFSTLVVALRDQVPSGAQTVLVRVGDTLPKIAARELGDMEQWQAIAAVNGLVPPYMSATPMPGLAAPGQQLYLPGSGGSGTAYSSQAYEAQFLGTDLYLGPINSPMNPWLGDFQLISSYKNLAFSLGRRVQTALGSLIYHIDYGSRIPPEVGSIITDQALGTINAFASSALKADPRVAEIIALDTQAGANFSVNISATVQPQGRSSLPTDVQQTVSQS